MGVIVLPHVAAAPGMLEMALPFVAMSAQTELPSPVTMAPSHEAIAASGVDWSTGPAVAPAVLVPVPVPVGMSLGVSLGVVALEVEPAEALGVDGWSTDLEQAASETDSASASAPVRSFFMRVLPDGWSVGTPILARRAPVAIAETQATGDAALWSERP